MRYFLCVFVACPGGFSPCSKGTKVSGCEPAMATPFPAWPVRTAIARHGPVNTVAASAPRLRIWDTPGARPMRSLTRGALVRVRGVSADGTNRTAGQTVDVWDAGERKTGCTPGPKS